MQTPLDLTSVSCAAKGAPIYNLACWISFLYKKMAWEAGWTTLAALQMFQMGGQTERAHPRAAVKLFRTQPAISVAMRKLEDWVGQPLFVRGSGARTLTDAGTLLLDSSSRMLNMREEIRKGLQELRGLERGQLSLGVNEV